MRLELLALRTIMDCGTEEEISDAKRAIETRFSSDACEDDDASSEDENSVAEDPWTRLKRKQSNNIRLTLPKTAGRREKRNLNAARVNSSPRSRSSGPVKRKELDAPRPSALSDAPRLSALSVARPVQLPEYDPMDIVDSASQLLVPRRKRKRLDEQPARLSLIGTIPHASHMESGDFAEIQTGSEQPLALRKRRHII
ncbi:hypothetical protein B0H13DRAFT_1924136 [Mycena leptocephala]|nr:hypothetical protein B0H13DRAFT_1924136 [Mycena leptocephala]